MDKLNIDRWPQRYQDIVDAVCARDREYFEQHPLETQRRRFYVPGELGPNWPPPGELPPGLSVLDLIIVVTWIAPGLRTRQPAYYVADVRPGGSKERK
ncbi:MAG: hypothetical protein HY329_17180 [Chloroflexi bacterium]|nr:hypothetical protein [Chloroflexota bacterium]